MAADTLDVIERCAVAGSSVAHLVRVPGVFTLCGRIATRRWFGRATRNCRTCEYEASELGLQIPKAGG